jgi:hypothetical protein
MLPEFFPYRHNNNYTDKNKHTICQDFHLSDIKMKIQASKFHANPGIG